MSQQPKTTREMHMTMMVLTMTMMWGYDQVTRRLTWSEQRPLKRMGVMMGCIREG